MTEQQHKSQDSRPVQAESVEEGGQSFNQQQNGDGEHGPDGPGTEHEHPTHLADTRHQHRMLKEEVPQNVRQL